MYAKVIRWVLHKTDQPPDSLARIQKVPSHPQSEAHPNPPASETPPQNLAATSPSPVAPWDGCEVELVPYIIRLRKY